MEQNVADFENIPTTVNAIDASVHQLQPILRRSNNACDDSRDSTFVPIAPATQSSSGAGVSAVEAAYYTPIAGRSMATSYMTQQNR